jgi:hypothetical protein
MTRLDEIRAQQVELEKELKTIMDKERDNVLAELKEKIKLFGFKTSDFRGVLVTRKKKKADKAEAKDDTAE